MEQLQNIDLILSIVVKVFFILISIGILFGLYSLLNLFRHIKEKTDEVTLNFKATGEQIKQELTVENFFNSFKNQLEKIVNIYLLDTARRQIFSVIKKLL